MGSFCKYRSVYLLIRGWSMTLLLRYIHKHTHHTDVVDWWGDYEPISKCVIWLHRFFLLYFAFALEENFFFFINSKRIRFVDHLMTISLLMFGFCCFTLRFSFCCCCCRLGDLLLYYCSFFSSSSSSSFRFFCFYFNSFDW